MGHGQESLPQAWGWERPYELTLSGGMMGADDGGWDV
jgi:hypothetical protein